MKRAAVILAEGFEEIEALAPVDLLRRAGVSVQVVGLDSAQVTGARGIRVTADLLFQELDPTVDMVILPGGLPGSKNLAAHKGLCAFLKERNNDKLLIAAICAAPVLVLGSLGILEGKNFTCFPGMESQVKGGHYTRENVVKDGHILTSRGVGTSHHFSLEIITILVGKPAAVKVAEACLIPQGSL